MKTQCLSMLSVFLLCLMPAVHAQDEVDSAWVMGMVYNMHNGRPMPYCTVSLLRGDDTVAVARTDENGEFMMGRHSTGEYRMQVRREFALYTMDLGLYGDALLSMAVDTVKHVDLVPVNVVAPRNMLSNSGQLITSPDDPRMRYTWEMECREASAGFRNSSLSEVAKYIPIYLDPKKTRNGRYVLLNDIFPDVIKPAAAPVQADTAAVKGE